MTEHDGVVEPIRGYSLQDRIEAVEEFAALVDQIVHIGDLDWSKHEFDFRLLAVNVSLRRQVESIQAATILARQNLGHLAVAFVRASLEDVLYLGFFASLTREESQELFSTLGSWDGLRSLLAQRSYVGDEVMQALWFSPEFLDAAEARRAETREKLLDLQKKYRWAGREVPSAAWIAKKSGKQELYNYLHSATSRSLHFSAGEILRRGWGDPANKVVTNSGHFREHLAAFALDQLWRLHVEFWEMATPFMEDAGISGDESITFEDTQPLLNRLIGLGKVPLVHAGEWNRRPPHSQTSSSR
ncbi:DUF5677 domain-containing protein [Streptomyces rutgersensis]|uniref:DUF5677 domain-containing protein n=1 Tax=Streptomyces rutgersensis TaxID=53451 RepID=UPI001FE5C751|nr:DUF5677 domain-containing protein [Streptomyces rutgersensis]